MRLLFNYFLIFQNFKWVAAPQGSANRSMKNRAN